jgi:calcineurin-like phosphoesterase family protein
MNRVLCRAAMLALAAAFLVAAPARADVPQELAGYVSDVPTATAYRYDLRDDQGSPMIGLKVASNPKGGYVGVYHQVVGSTILVKLARSTDLLNWTYLGNLVDGQNATLQRIDLPSEPAYDKSFVLAYQRSSGCGGTGGTGGTCLIFLRYPNVDALLAGSFSQGFIVPRTLSNCTEGTPNVSGASVNPNGKLVLDVGFHYLRNCSVARQAKGTLVDFSSWSAQVDTNLNGTFESWTPAIGGHVRDRDTGNFRGSTFNLHEAQLTFNDSSTWRPWLYDWQLNTLTSLGVRTHGGSSSFIFPTMTSFSNPDGSKRLVVTLYVNGQGAAAGEAGELLFYRDYDTAPPAPKNVRDELADYVADVPGATGYRYDLHDNRGVPMTGLKVAPNPAGGYLGVYQRTVGGSAFVELATSGDLASWTFVRDLGSNGGNPTIMRLGFPTDQSFILAYQRTAGCTGTGGSTSGCLQIARYTDLNSLLSGSPTQSFNAPRTLSNCAEGTPALVSASLDALSRLVLNLSFHYMRDCSVMRQAKGKLVDFSTWSAQPDTGLNTLFESATPTVGGHVRDRDFRRFRGLNFNLHEAQLSLNDPSSWRAWLYDWQANSLANLAVRTHGGSTSLTSPALTSIQNADGSGRLVVTYYVNSQGAAPGEAGELLFWRDYDPTIVAAGDISTTSISGQKRTSDLILANPATAVLSLGDNQYDNGELANFMSYYDPTWGRFKANTYPSPGNHDKCPDSGYDEYYGARAPGCWYSYDIGQWHLISLDSNKRTDSAQLAFLQQDLASTTKKCVAAYWHHPRFSSGSHGDQTNIDSFWSLLYAAGAELVLNGHDHDYERFAPQNATGTADYARGIREFVVGLGGRSKTALGSVKPNSEVRYNGGYGVLRLTLGDTGYSWRFESEAGKTFTDTGSGDCH